MWDLANGCAWCSILHLQLVQKRLTWSLLYWLFNLLPSRASFQCDTGGQGCHTLSWSQLQKWCRMRSSQQWWILLRKTTLLSLHQWYLRWPSCQLSRHRVPVVVRVFCWIQPTQPLHGAELRELSTCIFIVQPKAAVHPLHSLSLTLKCDTHGPPGARQRWRFEQKAALGLTTSCT